MRFSRPTDIKKTVLAAIVFLILIGTGSIIFETCRHTQTGDMEGYVDTFTRKMAETDAVYKPIADDISRARDEKTYYRCLYRLDQRMFENGDQTRAFEFLRQCLMLIKSDKSPSQEKKRFETHCYLMLGSASDETGLRSMSHSYYLEGLKKIDAYGIGELRGDFLNNLGVSMLRTDNNEEATQYFKKAISAAEKSRNRYLLSIIYTNLESTPISPK